MGVTDHAVLNAMASIPRHSYTDRFWATPPESAWTPQNVREFVVTDDADDETLRVVYDASTALATRGPIDVPRATSSLSAPIIVALMLAELHLTPGLRVLEIGAGSGYNAALMANLVGDPACVTALDIDRLLVNQTIDRLDRLGYGAMTVRCADGALGAPDRAPFDRIVATVGCADLSPDWVAQLAPGGQMLVPLEHGPLHPRVLVQDDGDLTGRFTGQSGFVAIQGQQNTGHLWPTETTPPTTSGAEALPSALLHALPPLDPAHPGRRHAMWNFAMYLAIRDRRVSGVGLLESGSVAMLKDSHVVFGGTGGSDLKARLLGIAGDWLNLGSPGLDRYAMRFSPLTARHHDPVGESLMGPWPIDRLSYRQTILLTPP